MAMSGLSADAQDWLPEHDGVYYIYNEASGLFLTRGENWGTQAVAKPIGLPWKMEMVEDRERIIRMYDLTVAKSTSGFGSNCYTDSTPIPFYFEGNATDGFNLKQMGTETIYLTCPAAAGPVSLSMNKSAWKFLTQAEYNAVLAAKVAAQESAIATAKGITIPEGKSLKDVVTDADNWAASATVNDGLPTTEKWKATNHTDRNNQYINWGDYGTEMYQVCNGHYTRTIEGLKKGIYKVTVRGLKRMGYNGDCKKMGDAGFPVSDTYLSANGNIIRIKAWYEDRAGDENPNSTGDFVNIANNGGYTSEGFVYVGDDGKLVLDAASEAYWGGSWFLFNGISYTYYDNSVSDADATAILEQATTLEGKAMQATIKSALTSAKTTFDGARTIANYNALSTAITNAQASADAYANLLTAITNANNYTTYAPVFEASTTIYSNAVSTAQGVYDAATVDDCTAAITALTDGIHSAYESDYDVFANDYAYDYSTLLNQDMTQWASTSYFTMTADEHWNGQNSQKYYEQSGTQWGTKGWELNASETATLPAGKYVMSITARASGDVTSTMKVKVGNADAITVSLPNKGASGRGITTDGVGSFADGTYANTNGRGWEYRFIAFEVAEESPVTISFKSKTEEQFQWVSLAAPLLKGDVHPNQIKLNQAKSLATTLAGYESQITTATYETFADHISAANNATVESTDLDVIISNLQTDIATAQAEAADIAAARASFQTMKNYADALVAVGNDNETANGTLASAISAQASAAASNSVDDINNATSTLKAAMTTYVGAANPVGDGAQFDCTFMLTNPDLTGLPTWNSAEGWSTEQTGGNSQVMTNNNATSEDGTKTAFYEYWSNPPVANKLFALYLKANLKPGTYKMTCYAFAQDESNGKHDNIPNGVYFYANDVQGSAVNNARLSEQSIDFVNSKDQIVMIGLKPVEGNGNTWMGIGYVQLYKVPAKAYDIDENSDWNSVDGAGDVTLKRTIKEGINTLVLPFSMTQAEVETYFGEGSIVYVASSYDEAKENISFTINTEGISANQPCLLKATVAGESYTIPGRTIVAGEPDYAANDGTISMIGTYAASLTVPENSYIINGGKFYLVNSTVTLKGTRAYFLVEGGNNARTLTMSFNDETTGIATLENGELKFETGDIYDLSGRKVKNPTKGIYLINGKKIIK